MYQREEKAKEKRRNKKCKTGELDVTINYIDIAQDIQCAIHFLNKLKTKLNKAAIEKKFKEEQ